MYTRIIIEGPAVGASGETIPRTRAIGTRVATSQTLHISLTGKDDYRGRWALVVGDTGTVPAAIDIIRRAGVPFRRKYKR